ncbi:prepilin-type N-terminal cleavage/methylation domain-containing protein [Aeromonas enteropelogenes]|uniref:type IV pilus modification PilV family protein n=1 Tax=Aeromonas enteropelogenes TaxID=29489 RepID=UPI0038CF66C5
MNWQPGAMGRQQGFNLVEIMVSMVLAVMVFLGLAKGQVVSLKQAHFSLQTTLATIAASNSVEQIWDTLCEVQRTPERFSDDGYLARFALQPGQRLLLPARYSDNLVVTIEWRDERVSGARLVALNAGFPPLC